MGETPAASAALPLRVAALMNRCRDLPMNLVDASVLIFEIFANAVSCLPTRATFNAIKGRMCGGQPTFFFSSRRRTKSQSSIRRKPEPSALDKL